MKCRLRSILILPATFLFFFLTGVAAAALFKDDSSAISFALICLFILMPGGYAYNFIFSLEEVFFEDKKRPDQAAFFLKQ